MSQTIAVIDYGMGNLHSVAKALEKVAPNDRVIVSADPKVLLAADKLVFPGVGAIRDCMAEINRLNIGVIVKEAIQSKPVLAICVGLQALLSHSEENQGIDCLDILPGEVKFFGDKPVDENGNTLKVPHMGWNQVQQTVDHPLWRNIESGSRFYFVHSYYVEPENKNLIAGSTEYSKEFAVALFAKNLFAVQFHPEKSHTVGLQLLENFTRWDGSSAC